MITLKLVNHKWQLKIDGHVYNDYNISTLLHRAEVARLITIERINLLPKQ